MDWVTANRVLLRIHHLKLYLHKLESIQVKAIADNVEQKERFYSGPELGRLAEKLARVEQLTLANFSSLFIRSEVSIAPSAPATDASAQKIVQDDSMDVDTPLPSAQHPSASPPGDPNAERFRLFRPLPALDGSSTELNWRDAATEALQFIRLVDTRTQWRSEDIAEDPAFMEPSEILQSNFRNIITRLTKPKVVHVRGDGNCFFRAVVKFIWPLVSQFYEDLLSVRLRALLNPTKPKPEHPALPSTHSGSQAQAPTTPATDKKEVIQKGEDSLQVPTVKVKSAEVAGQSTPFSGAETKGELVSSDPYKGFIIDDVNDSSTMSNPGVWADHVQVKKAADFFRRPIWLLRYDDANLIYDVESEGFLPGPNYRINTATAQEGAKPITLYFTPETHYEIIAMEPKAIEDLSNATLFDFIGDLRRGPTQSILKSNPSDPLDSDVVTLSAEHMCALAFALEKAAEQIEEKFALYESVDYSLRLDIRNELTDHAERAKECLIGLKQLVVAIRIDHFVQHLRQTGNPEGLLLDGVLAAICEDGVKITKALGKSDIVPGAGPLSSVLQRMNWCRSNIWTPSVESMKAYKRSQDKSLQEILSRYPSRGLLSSIAEEATSERHGDTKYDMESAAEALQLLASIAQPSAAKAPAPGSIKTSLSYPPISSGTPTPPVYAIGTSLPSTTAAAFAGTAGARPYNPHLPAGFKGAGATYESPAKRQKLSDSGGGGITAMLSNAVSSFTSRIIGEKATTHIGKFDGPEANSQASPATWEAVFLEATTWRIEGANFKTESLAALIHAAALQPSLKRLEFASCRVPGNSIEVMTTANSLRVTVIFQKCTLGFGKDTSRVFPSIEFKDCKFG